MKVRWDRLNGWHATGTGKGVWGYRTPPGAWLGYRNLNRDKIAPARRLRRACLRRTRAAERE